MVWGCGAFSFIYFLLFLKFVCLVMVSFCSFLCWAQMDWRGGGSHIKKFSLFLCGLFLSISVFFFNAPFVSCLWFENEVICLSLCMFLIVGISSGFFFCPHFSISSPCRIIPDLRLHPPLRPLSQVSFSFRWCFDRFVSFSYLCIPSSNSGVLWVRLYFFFENSKKKIGFERQCFLKHTVPGCGRG